MLNYRSISFWLENCGDDLTPRTAVDGPMTVDVAIVGGGLTGLWTAYYLLCANPALSVAVLERDIVGFGASGRNGGWCTPEFSVSPGSAIKRFGTEQARNLTQAMHGAVREVERIATVESMDIDWALGGSLEVALGAHGLPGLEAGMETFAKLGLESEYSLLDHNETAERVRIEGAKGALLTRNSAVLHPGKLVRQLARRVESKGGRIYEGTPVLDIRPRSGSQLAAAVTKFGTVEARLAVVLTAESYLSQIPATRRDVVPIYSLIVLTEPIPESEWAEIGWQNRETVGSTRLTVDYLQRTADGRILFGGRGAPYHFGSKMAPEFDRHEATHELLRKMTVEWFPMLKGVQFTHAWGGALGVTRDWTPNFFFDASAGLAGAFGYVGNGVSTTNLAGRLLRDLMLGTTSDLTELPVVQHRSPRWEPEPLRWIGIRLVQRGLERVDAEAAVTGQPPSGKSLAERLAQH